jgi:hypothetical protein
MARIVYRLVRPSAHMVFLFALLLTGVACAQQVTNGLINSDQTYVINDQGESVQEYGIGQVVYVVIDAKKEDKKRKDFYRVTFDPTNTKGDGWVLKDKVKLMTAYRSIDGKEPAEYERKAAPLPSQGGGMRGSSVASSGSATSEASTFLEELIKKDEQKPDLKPVTAQGPKADAVVAPKKGEKNPLENDLEFLFQEEGEFKKTYKEAKTEVQQSLQKKFAISKFTSGTDSFANTVLDQFSTKLQKNSKQNPPKVAYAANLEDATGVGGVTLAPDLDGVFFGQMSPKIGDARLLKIKYYDKSLKQFTFEKVAKIPLTNSTPTVEKLANDCYQFIAK